jgi:hypothetical protein
MKHEELKVKNTNKRNEPTDYTEPVSDYFLVEESNIINYHQDGIKIPQREKEL